MVIIGLRGRDLGIGCALQSLPASQASIVRLRVTGLISRCTNVMMTEMPSYIVDGIH